MDHKSNGQMPPHNHEAEQALLSCTCYGPTVLDLPGMPSEHEFHDMRFRRLFACAQSLHARGELVNEATLGEEAQSSGWLEEIGGVNFLFHLREYAESSAAGAAFHARKILDASTRRKLLYRARQLADAAQDCSVPIDELSTRP